MINFISLAIATVNAYEYPPVSLPMALYNLFRKNINRITAGLVYDEASSKMECIAATAVMSIRAQVPAKKLCMALHASFPEYGLPYVLSLRTMKLNLTEHGHEVSQQYVSANVPRSISRR